MTITFLVAINLEDATALVEASHDISDSLSGRFDVVSVKPWARPSVTPTVSPLAALPPLTEPQQPTT